MSKLLYVIGIILVGSVHITVAQRSTRELDNILQEGIDLVHSDNISAVPSEVHWLFDTNHNFSIEPSMKIQEWQQRHFHSDLGIRLTATANRHFGEGFDNELENFDRYRISLGVEWNLFEEGWFKNHSKAKILQSEAALLQLKQTDIVRQRNYGTQYNGIIYLFNKEKIKLLNSYLKILKQSLPIYKKYYLQHLLPYHELLELKKRIEKFVLIIDDYKAYNLEFEKTYGDSWKLKSAESLIPMSISLPELMKENELIEKQIKTRDLENQIIYLQNRTKSDIKVGLYARTNFTNGQIGGLNGNYHTIGMRVSVPLRSLYSHSNQLGRLEIEENNQRHTMRNKDRKKELMVHYYEYEYSLQQYTQLHYDRLKLKETIRQQSVRVALDSSRSSVIREYAMIREFMDVGYEMLGVRQLLYLSLLQMQVKWPDENIANFCEPVIFGKDKKLIGNRIFHITNNEVLTYGMDFIINYLVNNEAYQILATTLTSQQQAVFEAHGFELIDCITDSTCAIAVQNFKDRLAIESFIEHSCNAQSKILFDSFSSLIRLEMNTLLNP